MRKYFITSLPTPGLEAILSHCLEDINTVRYSLDDSMVVFKLAAGVEKPSSFNAFTEYTHETILIEMAKPEWTPTDP